MAITSTQAENVAVQSAFLLRLEFQIALMAENIASESSATAKHAQRAALASQVMQNPATFTALWAPDIVSQFTLSTANMVGTTDVDVSDAALGTIVSSLWNDWLPQP